LIVWLALAFAQPIADMVATGDCAPVLKAVAVDASEADLQLAAAWCALKIGRADEALDRLTGPDFGPLDRYARWQRGRALLQLDRREEARAAFEGVQLPAALGPELDWLRAQSTTDSSQRIKALEAMFAGPLGPRARLAAAELHGEQGHADRQVALLREVWTDASPGGHDRIASERLQALGSPEAPDGASGDALRAARAKSLNRAYRHDEALVLYEALWGPSPTTTTDRLALADARSRARDHKGAIELWSQVYGVPEAAKGSADGLFTYALAHARISDYATATTLYRAVIAQHPTHKQADFASFKIGYMAWDEGRFDDAIREFTTHIERYPQSSHLDEALWFRARARWDTDRDAAMADLRTLRAQRASSSLASGAAYWLAMHLVDAGDPAGPKELEKVLLNWPTSGYAWFAAARLGRSFPHKPDATVPAPSATLSGRADFQRAQRLSAAGLRSWAQAELAGVKATGADVLPLAWARLDAGDYRGAQKLACPLAGKPWQDKDPIAQQACTPRPERRLVEAVAKRYGLDPSIPFGVMVAESNLDPAVTSPAGARGLMQLMPAVGERLHPDLFGDRPFDVDDLYAGPYNAALGTLELGQRTQSLRGVLEGSSVPAVVASYNGGEEAVRRWVATYESPPPFDAWSEAIGYTETRHYVKRVLGNAMAIRWVYGDGP
jgi:soluble lytic murein transglycosylase-like protein